MLDDVPSAEPTKPTKRGFEGFVGSSARLFSVTKADGWARKLPVSDPYAERMREALRHFNCPDYPAGMIQWLGTARPDLYARLTSNLPDEIQRLWSEREPLEHFETVLARLVSLHRQCRDLYHAVQSKGLCGPRSNAP
jgi:hypothetical protein